MRKFVENVLLNIDRYIFPVDFISLDMEENREIPPILGQPFLAIEWDLIYVHKWELVLRLNDD